MLTELKAGDKCTICNLNNINLAVKKRLKDFGVTEGCEVCIKRVMPLGGPFMLQVKGQTVAIRKNEASKIEVERF